MIIRKKLEGNYTRIPNEFLLDETISDKARGTLARLLSRPDSWNVNVNHLVKTGKDGHTALRSSLTELVDAGYLHKEITRGDGGRITGTEYLVFDHRVDPAEMCSNVSRSIIQDGTPEQEHTSQVKTQTRDIHVRDDDRIRETHIRETEDVITNKGINNQGIATTTTPAPESKVEVMEPSSQSYPATEDINSLLNLIPEQHRHPMVISLVNQSAKKYTVLELEEAIVYSSANVKGDALQYKAYLDKTLRGKWAAGYLETLQKESISPALFSPGGFAGGIPAGKYPNGTVTGCKRMDSNYMAAAAFLADMGVDV